MNVRPSLKLCWSDDQPGKCLTISGWNKSDLDQLRSKTQVEIREYLAVLPAQTLDALDERAVLQPIPGTFHMDQKSVRFEPLFPFLKNTLYSLIVYKDTEDNLNRRFESYDIQSLPNNLEPAGEIISIYPTANQIPVNQLKFYLHFSEPMAEGNSGQSITLQRTDTGEHLSNVFLHEPELWDHEHKRLTILLDPARIKRGLQEHVKSGYPLVQDTVILFSISESFLDAQGAKLKSSQEITYKIGPPERRLVEIKNWQYHYPRIDSLQPITVEFDRPLDHALIQRCICIKDDSGHEVRGTSQTGFEERSWQFFPQVPWSIGRYNIIVEDILEDLAGNSIKRVFDRELLDDQSVHDIPVTRHSFYPKFQEQEPVIPVVT